DRVEAGCVTVNDLVAPTADPRAPFSGWNSSGFGVTRGAEGLLEMTRLKAVVSQTAGWLPHLDPPRPGLDRLVIGLLRMSHGRSLGERWRGLRDVIAAGREK
ncbi:MAG: aldehyde dehydrogenase family protein, partial [Planctomycetota bacterium]